MSAIHEIALGVLIIVGFLALCRGIVSRGAPKEARQLLGEAFLMRAGRNMFARVTKDLKLFHLEEGMKHSKLILGVVACLFIGWSWIAVRTASATTAVTVNEASDNSDFNLADGVCDTDNQADGEQCSLRAAIEQLNALGADPDPHEVHFNIPGVGPHVIAPLSGLPWIQVPVVIDGETQPGAACPTAGSAAILQVVLDGSNAGNATGLWLHTGSEGSILRGLVIGNFGKGIEVSSNGNRIECSHIGVGADGVTDIGNADSGVTLGTGSDNNVVGGDASHNRRNVISGNNGEGIFFSGNENTIVANNYIGTTADGLSPLGNADGIFLIGAANLVGGTSALARNVISGNGDGVYLLDSQNSQVWSNLIGVGADGVTPVPNSDHGVYLAHSTSGNLIGGPTPAQQNVIAHNEEAGIYGLDGEQNALRGNRIYTNGTLGIDLLTNGIGGVDVNDPGDLDGGPNQHQNYPVLNAATDQVVSGVLDTIPNQTFELDFYTNTACDPSGHGEGETYLGTAAVTTDGSGQAGFNYSLSGGVSPGDSVTATATDPLGNTSEFSACVTAEPANPPTPTPTPGGPTSLYLPVVSKGAPLPSTSGALEDGDIYSGMDGVTLGAVSGTLTSTLDVTISYTSVPTPMMIAGSPVHGEYYRIAAERDVYVSDPDYFVLGLPVPAGVPTGTLGVAVHDETAHRWAPILGFYDDVSELMLVPLSGLSRDGKTVVLIENTGFSSVRPSTPAMTSKPFSKESDVLDFEVECLDEYSTGFHVPDCNGHGDILTDFLALVFTEFDDMGYKKPWLENTVVDLSILDRDTEEPSVEVQVDLTTYQVYGLEQSVFPDICSLDPDLGYLVHGPGAYLEKRKAMFCFNFSPESALTNAQMRAIRHLYFHALQLGYVQILKEVSSGGYDTWVLESTASAAEISIPVSMESSDDHPRRAVDVPLESDAESSEFSAQDLWVYHGRSEGIGLTMFPGLLNLSNAATTDGAIQFFGGEEDFKATFWRWVKNQAMLEDGIRLNDDDTGLQCEFQPSSLEDGVGGLGGNQDFWVDIELPPLTSNILRLESPLSVVTYFEVVNPDWPGPLRDPNLQYKVYVDSVGCAGAVENGRVERDVFGETTDFYVVVSNVHPTETREYLLTGD